MTKAKEKPPLPRKVELLLHNAKRLQDQSKEIERLRLARKAIRLRLDADTVRRLFDISQTTYDRLCGQKEVT